MRKLIANEWMSLDAVVQAPSYADERSEEHTSELQSQSNLVCRLLLEKKKQNERTSFKTPRARLYLPASSTSRRLLSCLNSFSPGQHAPTTCTSYVQSDRSTLGDQLC